MLNVDFMFWQCILTMHQCNHIHFSYCSLGIHFLVYNNIQRLSFRCDKQDLIKLFHLILYYILFFIIPQEISIDVVSARTVHLLLFLVYLAHSLLTIFLCTTGDVIIGSSKDMSHIFLLTFFWVLKFLFECLLPWFFATGPRC